MPTLLPARRSSRLDLLLIVLFVLSVAICIIEIVDRAPMLMEAEALITSP